MAKIADVRAGGTIELELLRGGKKFSKTLKAEKLESRIGKEYTLEKWGAGMREITKPYARESKLDTDSRLMVAGVRQGFPFDAAGICAGDIIVSADRKKVSTEAELRAVYESYRKSPKKILVEILRDRALSFHILAPPEN